MIPFEYIDIKLYGQTIYVKDNGAVTGGVSIVDFSMSGRTRARILAQRSGAGEQNFEMVNVSGKRIVKSFGKEIHNVPEENVEELNAIYGKIVRQTITVSTDYVPITTINFLYTMYKEAQRYWAERANAIAKLSESDLSRNKYVDLDAAADGLLLAIPYGDVITPVYSGPAIFAEGSSFTVTASCINVASSLNATLVFETRV